MSVRIIDIEYLNRIGKFLSLSMAEGLAKEKVMKFHRLNCLSYHKANNQEFLNTKYAIEDLDFTEIPLISSVQAVSDLEAVFSNCLDSGDELDLQTFEEMRKRITMFQEDYDYPVMKKYKDHVKF